MPYFSFCSVQENNIEPIESWRKVNETLFNYQNMDNSNNNTKRLVKKRSTETKDENFLK